MNKYQLDYLEQLEAESIFIMREVAAQFENPALLFSGGKDSITLVHLAKKAFAPMKIPFPLVHIDTGHNFPEALAYRDHLAQEIGAELIVRKVEDTIREKKLTEPKGKFASRNWLQTHTLLDTIEEFKFDACIGGARRDEEKARAKERFFSVRDEFGQWDPRNQRPELWNLYNGRIHEGESVRVFPLSNWTEMDVWEYILEQKIPIVPLYFSKPREVIKRGNMLIPAEGAQALEGEKVETVTCRFRTLGCYPLTGGCESTATTLDEIIDETLAAVSSERTTRVIDNEAAGSMERRKREGYF